MKFEDWWKYWLESHRQNPPEHFNAIKTNGGPKPYWLTPEDMMAVENAFTPWDLWKQPNRTPNTFDYATPAVHIKNTNGIGIPEAILLASQRPENPLLSILSLMDVSKSYLDIPQNLKRFIPQAIYEHEKAHAQDPRIRPDKYNYGYLTVNGLPGELFASEYPAMKAEDRFWRDTFSNMQRKRATQNVLMGKVKEKLKNSGGWFQTLYDMMNKI